MKLLKKMTCLVLALTMLLTACAFAEEDTNTYFDLFMVKGLGLDVDTWMSASLNRAMFTVLLFMDAYLGAEDQSIFDMTDLTLKNSYVGLSDDILVVYCHTGSGDMLMFCDPTADNGAFSVYPITSDDSATEAIMASLCEDGYYKNSTSDIQSAIEIVQSALISD